MKRDMNDETGSLPLVKRNRLIYKKTEDGNVVGFTPEEYGVHPTVTPKRATMWTSIFWIIVLAVAITLTIAYLTSLPSQFALVMWAVPVILLLLFVGYCKKLYTELRARSLRQDRGLPEPIE